MKTAIILLLATGVVFAQQSVRDSRREAVAGTASVSGVVTSDERTPQEIKRARVELSADGQPPQSAFTDDHGRFAFNRIAAGRYTLTATKPGFVRAAYGAKRADRPGTPITIADGQQLPNVALKMARGAVIAGVVRDETGQPAPGVSVRVLQYRMQNGERALVPAGILASGPLGETTDDLGMYRIFGLPASEYIVSATPRPLGAADIRQMTSAEIQSVRQALQQQGGTVGAAPALAPRPQPVTVTYAPVFYPGTISAASASAVTVAAGEERGGIDFALQLVRTARVEGVVVAPNGVSPQATQLLMLPRNTAAAGLPAMIAFNRVTPGPDGKFSWSGVAPGQYTISARVSGPGGNFTRFEIPYDVRLTSGTFVAGAESRGQSTGATSALWATADITVDGENLTDITLSLQPGLTVSGRVVIEAVGVNAPDDLSRARVSLGPAGSSGLMIAVGGAGGAQIDRTGRFTLSDVTPGKYRLNAQFSTPEATWTLKSAVVSGKDSLDFPIDIGPGDRISDAVITFTNQTQEVKGTLQDAAGRGAPDFTIVVFPADKAYWLSARRIRTTRPGTDGTFLVRGLPAGEYRIAALVDIAPGEANDPALLEELVPASVAFVLRAGESKIQNIKMAGG